MGVQLIQPSFSAGELSPALSARVDLAKYSVGAKRLKNFFVHPHGGVSNRSGFEHIASAGNAEGVGRLVSFIYSKQEAYILEFSDRAARVFFDGKPLRTEDGSIYEFTSPYREADLGELRFTQSADVLFVCHPSYPVQRLVRLGHLTWQFEEFEMREGPFLAMNSDEIKVRVTGVASVEEQQGHRRMTEPGEFEFVVPEGVTRLRVKMIGGGGGMNEIHKANVPMVGSSGSKDRISISIGSGNTVATQGTVAPGGESYLGSFRVAGGSGHSGSRYGDGGIFPEDKVCAAGDYAGSGYGAGAGGAGSNWRGCSAGSFVDGHLSVTPGEVVKGCVGAGGLSDSWRHGAPGCIDIRWNTSVIAGGKECGTLEASEDLFRPEHVGALWKVRHSIPSISAKGFQPDGTLELEVTAHSKWFVDTSGYWMGQVKVEKYDTLNGEWALLRTLNSQKDRNYSESGSVGENTRVRVTGNPFTRAVPSGGDGAMLGEVTLETLPTVYDGFVKILEYIDAKTVRVQVEKAVGSNEWTLEWAEGAWNEIRGYPGCCTFYQDRLCFGGSSYEPGVIWMSRIGDYNNFGTHLPLEDDDGITIRLVSRRIGRIRSLIGISELIALTESGEWKIGSAKGALTPVSIEARPQGYRGSDSLEPVLIGDRVIFLREMGATVQDLGYSFESDTYTGSDLSILSKHLLEGHRIVDWKYQQEPDSIIWAVRSDGRLLGITYLREQEIWAWHSHETRGQVESIAVIPGAEQEELWSLVRRNGRLWVERMRPRCTELEEAFFVDGGKTFRADGGEWLKRLCGLEHLAEKEVAILADGSVWPRQRVRKLTIDGDEVWGIELEKPAKIAQVGLPYESELETLNLEIQSEDGTLQGKKKKVPKVTLRVLKSCGGGIGARSDKGLNEIQWHKGEHYGKPLPLYTGDKTIRPGGGYREDGSVVVRQGDPLPFTVLAVIPEVIFGG